MEKIRGKGGVEAGEGVIGVNARERGVYHRIDGTSESDGRDENSLCGDALWVRGGVSAGGGGAAAGFGGAACAMGAGVGGTGCGG